MQNLIKKLLALTCIATLITPRTVNAEDVTSNSTNAIESFQITTDEVTYAPTQNEAKRSFKYVTEFSVSGTEKIPTARLKLPASIFTKRDGSVGDTFKISIPSKKEVEEAIAQGEEVTSLWMYEIIDGEVVISNRRPVPSGKTYNFEYAYQLTDKASEYRDMSTSAEHVNATVELDTAGGQLTSSAELQQITINTYANIEGVKGSIVGDVFKEWDDAWGEKPADADAYFYSELQFKSVTRGNQPYKFTIESTATDANDSSKTYVPYKYNIGTNGWVDNNSEAKGYQFIDRIDSVLYRFPKAEYEDDQTVSIRTTNKFIVEGIDHQDEPMEQTTNVDINYFKDPWSVKEGNFISLQYGDNIFRVDKDSIQQNWSSVGVKLSEYSRYDLQDFQSGKLKTYNNLDFGYYIYGMPEYYTVEDGKERLPENYFKQNVIYEQFVDGIKLKEMGSIIDNLTSEDYQIQNVALNPRFIDAKYDSTYNKFKPNPFFTPENAFVEVYAKYDNQSSEYVHVADYDVAKNQYNIIKEGLTSSGNNLKFDNNVIAYKLVSKNPYYFTEILAGSSYELKHSPKVDAYVANKEDIIVQSEVHGFMRKANGEEIFNYTAPLEYDFARKTQTDSRIRKNVAEVLNNRIKKQYELTWVIDTEETARTSSTDVSSIPQDGGKWFDLMPAGLIVDENNVTLEEKDGSKTYNVTVTTKENYKNTGRTLVIFETSDQMEHPILKFKTLFPYDNIRDYGGNVYNPVAFETGNGAITDGTADDASILRLYKEQMSNLTKDKGNRFIYADTTYNLSTLVYFSSGLKKAVKNSTDGKFTANTVVAPNEDYFYKLTFANSATSNAKDIILFDNIEKYTTPDGDKPNWRGILKSIDTTQMERLGFAPVLYGSTQDIDLETLRGLTPEEKLENFTRLNANSDLSAIKTIAIDCRRKSDNSIAYLGKSQSLVAILNMKAPEQLPIIEAAYKNYNVVYAHATAVGEAGAESPNYIFNGYTTTTYKIMGDFQLNKQDATTRQPVSGIQFKLSGRSSYGEYVDEIKLTDSKGMINFKKIPVGKYTLTEYETTPDYFLNEEKHVVEITEHGQVLIDNKEASEITIFNTPRVHANVVFEKKTFPNKEGISAPIEDVEFTLSGTSDYGNDLIEKVRSDKSGKVIFKNIEKGTYKLKETYTPQEFMKLKDELEVKIDDYGVVTITNKATNTKIDTVFNYNRLARVEWYKLNGETNQPIWGDISFQITGTDYEGVPVNTKVSPDYGTGKVSVNIPVGTYTVRENQNPTTNDRKKFMQDPKEYTLVVNNDGTYVMDMEQVDGKYIVKNMPAATDSLIITKKWVNGNPDGYIPKIRVYTNIDDATGSVVSPQGENNTGESGNTGTPETPEPDEGL